MAAYGCKKLVFSSSATVYGWPKEVPCTEEFPLSASNPYERTKKIPLVKTGRRPGDAEIVYAATAKAEWELNWKAKYGIEDMCRDQWNWACKNPYGYQTQETN